MARKFLALAAATLVVAAALTAPAVAGDADDCPGAPHCGQFETIYIDDLRSGDRRTAP